MIDVKYSVRLVASKRCCMDNLFTAEGFVIGWHKWCTFTLYFVCKFPFDFPVFNQFGIYRYIIYIYIYIYIYKLYINITYICTCIYIYIIYILLDIHIYRYVYSYYIYISHIYVYHIYIYTNSNLPVNATVRHYPIVGTEITRARKHF